jgi:hypothetical protein
VGKRVGSVLGGVQFALSWRSQQISDRRTSHIAALLQSCTSFPFSQKLFVSPEISPVIAIRFDFPSFSRTEKEEEES